MSDELQDVELAEVLKAARPEPRPGWEERIVTKLAERRPRARAVGQATPSRRSSRRLLVASVVAALGLLGFGLTRLPVSSASELFEGFLAAASQAKALHMTATIDDDGTVMIDKWDAPEERFSRYEHWVASELIMLRMSDGEFTVSYMIDPRTGRGEARERFDVLGQGAALQGCREPAPSLGPLDVFEEPLDSGNLDLIYRGRERNDLGEAVDVVEVEWRPEGTYMMYYFMLSGSGTGLHYEDGERVRIRVEVDPATNLPRTMTHSVEENGARRTTFEAEFEWNAEIPEAARNFTPPPGSTVEHDYWWERRFPEVVAQGETRNCVVTLHAIDSDRQGRIHLSLSYVDTDAVRTSDSQPLPRVEALGSNGERYEQEQSLSGARGAGCAYLVLHLIPLHETPQPDAITLTITPHAGSPGEADSPSEGQSVTFENIPLPPRQPVDDVRAAEVEVIQY